MSEGNDGGLKKCQVSLENDAERMTQAHPDFLPLYGIPIYSFEPLMSLDVLGTSAEVPESFREVSGQEPSYQILRDWVDVRGNAEFPGEDLFVNLEGMVGKERRVSSEKLEEEDAECPPVGGSTVTSGGDLTRQAVLADRVRSRRSCWGKRRTISGEMYSGVPQSVHVRSLTYLA